MKLTRIGVDIAKQVFQLHDTDLRSAKYLLNRNTAACPLARDFA